MNKGLKHILEVYRLIRQNYLSRIDAAKRVGKANRVTYETVMASCTKGINISTDDFDYFLEAENSSEFHAFLIKRFPNAQDNIDDFFSAFIEISDKARYSWTSSMPVIQMISSSCPLTTELFTRQRSLLFQRT